MISDTVKILIELFSDFSSCSLFSPFKVSRIKAWNRSGMIDHLRANDEPIYESSRYNICILFDYSLIIYVKYRRPLSQRLLFFIFFCIGIIILRKSTIVHVTYMIPVVK